MRGTRNFPLKALATATALLSASCGSQETTETESSLNQTQAEERIEEYINQAAAEISSDIELSPVNDPAFPSCEGEPGDANHTVTVRYSFWVDGIPSDKNEEAAESLYAYWDAGNWEIIKDERPERLQIEARNRDDQFRMKLLVNQEGQPSLSGYSPCVQADQGS